MKRCTILTCCFAVVAAAHVVSPAWGQPSGGPYGPVQKVYEVPEAGRVYFVAVDGDPSAAGTSLETPTTIAAAIERVVTGDAVVMRGGEYRTGGLLLNQGITLQPYRDEQVVFKGTQVATEWEALPNNVWRTRWTTLFPASPLDWWQRSRNGTRTPLHRFNNDMVFVDGEPLVSAGWEGELGDDSYYIDYDTGWVYIGSDPSDRIVEITAFDSALVRTSRRVHGKRNDRKGPTIRGITFTQYAYRCLEVEGKRQFTSSDEPTDEPIGLADPASFGKEVIGTVLENLTITHCSRVAGYFRGDGLVIRNSLVSDTSTEGIYVIGSADVVLEKNIIRRNNVEQLTGYFPAAVKIFNQSRRVTFRDNLVIDNSWSNGVWFDVGIRDVVVADNWIEDAIDGLFFEISRGATVVGNVFVRNHKGVRVLNSADARVYNNTFVDSPASFERNERSAAGDHFGWHPSTGPDVDEREGHVFVNNLLVAGRDYRDPLLRFEQPASLCKMLDRPMATRVDGNAYVRPASVGVPLLRLSPAATPSCVRDVMSLQEARQFRPGFEEQGLQLILEPRSVFRSPDLGHYDLRRPIRTSTPLPVEVLESAGWTADDVRYVGAWPRGIAGSGRQ